MQFDSYIYAVLLAVVFALYWALRERLTWQNVILLAASYLFYGWWDWRFLSLILFTSLTTFSTALLMDGTRHRRLWLVVNIVANLAVLAVFKYLDFFADSAVAVLSLLGVKATWSTLHIVLPVGISFYTFQAIGYTIDVYRGTVRPTRQLLPFLVFVSFFPQLVAGPIERASRLLPQFTGVKHWDYDMAVTGMRQILWGLAKKVVIADTLATHVDFAFYHPAAMNPAALLVGAVLFAFQIYADFSGYSDIAIGSARLLGITLTPNFRYPFFSRSMRELWQRWHISLMSWFKDYVYIPLGGSRHGKWRACLATMTVFTLSGLWHGANVTFVLWGVAGGLMLLPSVLHRGKRPANVDATWREIPQCLWIFLCFAALFVLFRVENVAHLAEWCHTVLHGKYSLHYVYGWEAVLTYVVPFVVIEWLGRHHEFPIKRLAMPTVCRWAVYWCLAALIVWHSHGVAHQYIYFRF